MSAEERADTIMLNMPERLKTMDEKLAYIDGNRIVMKHLMNKLKLFDKRPITEYLEALDIAEKHIKENEK